MNIEKVTPPIFVESDETSILLVWQTVPGADCYELQISEDLGGKWIILSSTIKSNSIRKKNLISQLPNGYVFRMKYCIRSNSAEEWSDVSPMSKPMFTQSAGNEVSKMEPPILLSKDAISVTISWAVVYEASGYIIRYRESSSDWTVITSPVAGISVRKKGLSEGKQYYFSVKPANLAEYEFSMSSQPFTVVLCSPKIKSIFPPKLSFGKLKNEPTTTLLAGKIVAIYFSAHWCGPCRNFTPQLVQFYEILKRDKKQFEVVFCSADHTEEEFESYYATMPWLAIGSATTREQLMSEYSVRGIPQLTILAPSGNVIAQNATSSPLTTNTFNTWSDACKL